MGAETVKVPSSCRSFVFQVYDALKTVLKDRPAFVFHGFKPRKELCGGFDMEADFVLVLPGAPVTVLTIECKTELTKKVLGKSKQQWKATKQV